MSISWCFTINNPSIQDDDALVQLADKCDYIIIAIEHPDATPHYQGYFELEKKANFRSLQKLLPRAHLETRRGTQEQAITYCKKEDPNPFEQGQPRQSKQGQRTDIQSVTSMIKEHTPMREVADAHPELFVKFHKGLLALAHTLMPERSPDQPPTVKWLWGPAGVGKTRSVWTPTSYIKDNTKWWDGYSQQPRIIIDDFDPKCWEFRTFLQVIDRYPFRGEIKGGYVPINSPEIFITCEHNPQFYWSGNTLDQVTRRLAVEEVAGNTSPPLLPPESLALS